MAVSTIKASLGDYSSLNAWEAAKQADLTGLGPEEAECYDFQDTTDVAISGWTTTGADYARAYTPTAERHNGTSRDVSGSGYQLTSGSNSVLRIAEEFVRVEGLDISVTGTSGLSALIWPVALAATTDCRVSECILHDAETTAKTTYTVNADQANLTLQFRNNITYGNQRTFRCLVAAAVDMDHCTFYTALAAFCILGDTELTCHNTYCGGAATEDFYTGGAAPTGSNNASSDTTATTDYTSSLISKAAADQFVNASLGASADFHLKSGSALEGAGTNTISTDIDGDARDGTTPDIGADEFVGAGVTTPVFMHHYKMMRA